MNDRNGPNPTQGDHQLVPRLRNGNTPKKPFGNIETFHTPARDTGRREYYKTQTTTRATGGDDIFNRLMAGKAIGLRGHNCPLL